MLKLKKSKKSIKGGALIKGSEFNSEKILKKQALNNIFNFIENDNNEYCLEKINEIKKNNNKIKEKILNEDLLTDNVEEPTFLEDKNDIDKIFYYMSLRSQDNHQMVDEKLYENNDIYKFITEEYINLFDNN